MNKIGRIVALLLSPILIPIRVCVTAVRYSILKYHMVKLPTRVIKAKMKALEEHRRTKRKQYGLFDNYRIKIYDSTEMRRMTKRVNRFAVRKFGFKKVDFDLETIFTVENGKIIDRQQFPFHR